MKNYISGCLRQLRASIKVKSALRNTAALCISLLFISALSAWHLDASQSIFPDGQSLIAYNIDMGMDEARGEKTIEYHGEELREVVEQTLRNNVNHPESKDTAKNSYKRESALNNILPEKRSSAFSKQDLSKLRETKHPKDILK